MIFTRIGRSVSRSSRFGNLLNGRGRSAGLIGNGGISGVPRCGSYLGPVDGELRFLRSYFAASIAAHKARVSDFSCILANPKLCLHFSSETPKKKNSENFHPKEKKEIPKGDEQKTKPKVFDKLIALVYVRSSPRSQTSEEVVQGPDTHVPAKRGQCKYFIIGSIESFEKRLEDAQEALGIDSHDFVPVTYGSNMVWFLELMRFLPTLPILLLLGSFLLVEWRTHRGLGIGGRSARGIFNIGKAQVTKVDKNAKNQIYFKDVAGCDEAKQEIMEFVHFLKNPQKYEDLGAKIPKGA
ncbi:hypothetical protein TB2_028979 [Malus domestica]|uniref:Uncharacterized protein n=1 Tax=Malus domestica TaxID=3750 RepID=A0A498KFU6_MALDO|nr:hypothetical protein DVH24_038617 [Malus domestica]